MVEISILIIEKKEMKGGTKMSRALYEEVFGGFSVDEIARLEEKKGKWLPEVEAILRKAAEKPNPILRRLYEEERIVIGPTDGSETIAQASNVFTGGIDPDFINWDLDHPCEPTEEREVEVQEMAESATFAGMFAFLLPDLDSLVLTQHQVKSFCREHRDKLHPEGWATFFLLKEGEEFFVANVFANSGGQLEVLVCQFENDCVWDAEDRHRLVVPQLSP